MGAAHVTRHPGADATHVPFSLALARLAQLADRQLSVVLQAEGLRVEDWRVLDHLARSGKSTMSELAEAALVSGATVTRAVDKLTSLGLAHRTAGVHDRRTVHVNLSTRGAKLHATLSIAVEEAETGALHAFANDPTLQAALSRRSSGSAGATR
jgi:DNA-binding MarR family transcriptional regulator